MRVAVAYNLKRTKPERGGAHDEEAEYDAPSTVAAIADAIASWGHEVVRLEADRTFPSALLAADVDVVFNVAEGSGGRSREAQVPAFLELVGVPYTGSDPAALVVTLDKALAKSVVRNAGIPTPRWLVMTSGEEALRGEIAFPVVVKPVAEGSSKGVLPGSVACSEDEARALARRMIDRYAEGALVEEYLPGREFTVGILGGGTGSGARGPGETLPPMEIVHLSGAKLPVYTFDHKLEPNDEIRYEVPARIPPELESAIRDLAVRAFAALGCRDVARVDIRLDAGGRPSFIECNPLPGLTPGWSDLCLIGDAAGLDYRRLIARILAPALERTRPTARA